MLLFGFVLLYRLVSCLKQIDSDAARAQLPTLLLSDLSLSTD